MSRIAVITGANRGLGLGTAKNLIANGYTVVLTARSESKAADAAATIGGDVIARQLDVSSQQSVDSFFDWLRSEHGRIDVLVNNAGAIFERTGDKWDVGTLEVSADVVGTAYNTNTLGAYRMMLHALPMMNDAGYGRVVNVSSGMGAVGDMGGGYPAYRLSKAALNAATRVFADEALGDVKVNCICPGWVKTDMGGAGATRELDEGVSGIVWAAMLPEDGPSNGFFRDGQAIDW